MTQMSAEGGPAREGETPTIVAVAIIAPTAPGREVTTWRRRVAPVATTVAVGAAAVLVWRNDPAAPGSHFPACPFHAATGLWCPGCGLTRGMHALLHGDVGAALAHNVLTPVAAVVIVWALLAWLLRAWDRQAPRPPRPVARALVTIGPVVLVAFGVLRNLPLAPFRALAP